MEWRQFALYFFAVIGVLTALLSCVVVLHPALFILSLSLSLSLLLFPFPPYTSPIPPTPLSVEEPASPGILRVRFASPSPVNSCTAPSTPSSDEEVQIEVLTPVVARPAPAPPPVRRILEWSPPHGAWIPTDRAPPDSLLDHAWVARNPELYREWAARWQATRRL